MPNNSEKIPELKQFQELPLDTYQISVTDTIEKGILSNAYSVNLFIYCPDEEITHVFISNRDYSEFKDLYELITAKNPSNKIPEFPSRFRFIVLSKEERINFFNLFLNTILQLINENNTDIRNELLKSIYNFVFGFKDVQMKKLTKKTIIKKFKITKEKLEDYIEEDEQKLDNINDIIDDDSKSKNTDNCSVEGYDNKSVISESEKENLIIDDNKSVDLNNNRPTLTITRKQTIDLHSDKNLVLSKSNNVVNLANLYKFVKKKINSGIHSPGSNIWEDLYVKTSLNDYCLNSIKVIEKCIQFFNKKDEDKSFYLMFPLYKINIEIYRIIYIEKEKKDKSKKITKKIKYITSKEIYKLDNYDPKIILLSLNTEIVIKLYHDYDTFETFIKFDKDCSINTVKTFLATIEPYSYLGKIKSAYINEITENDINSYGNLLVDIIKVKAPFYDGKLFVKVNINPYTFITKTIEDSNDFIFNQKFLIPKHNRFKYLIFSIFTIKEEGLIIKTDSEELIGDYKISLPELLNTYFLSKNSIIRDIKLSKENEKLIKFNDMTIEFKIKDFSSLLSLAVKNVNKRILDDYPLHNIDGNTDEPYTINTMLKRIKRVLAIMKNIYYSYKMIQRFKYPVLSTSILFLVIYYYIFCDPRFILTHILFFFTILLFSYSQIFNKYFYPYYKTIFLSIRNRYDTPSLIARTESQQDREEVNQNDYLANKKKGFQIPTLKQIKEIREAYIDVLFRLSRMASFFEKFKNLFLWTDPLLSFYMMVIFCLVLLFIWNINGSYLILIGLVQKFLFGIFYYKNKYINNKEVARIVVKDTYEKWKKGKKDDKKIEEGVIKTMEKKGLDDEKLKILLKEKLYEHCSILLNDNFYDSIETIGDVIDELAKIEDVIKIRRTSSLFYLTKNNKKIYQKDVDIDDRFIYYIQNIKSDYYMVSNGFINSNKETNSDEVLFELMNEEALGNNIDINNEIYNNND